MFFKQAPTHATPFALRRSAIGITVSHARRNQARVSAAVHGAAPRQKRELGGVQSRVPGNQRGVQRAERP